MIRAIRYYLWALIALVALAGCNSATMPSAAVPQARPTQPAEAQASIPTAGTPIEPSAEPSAAAGIMPAPSAVPEAVIEQGVTPEGYHFLGRADAPVTIVHYSDFF